MLIFGYAKEWRFILYFLDEEIIQVLCRYSIDFSVSAVVGLLNGTRGGMPHIEIRTVLCFTQRTVKIIIIMT